MPSRSRHQEHHRLAGGFTAAARITLPVLFLTLSFLAIYLYLDRPFPLYASIAGMRLTLSHVLLAVAFLVVHLTNRRYGPDYAFAQIVLSLALCGTVVALRPDLIRQLLPEAAMPTVREVSAFVVAFLAAGILSIIAFDATRGPRWWMAPLVGSLVAGFVYALTFYPTAYFGTGEYWCQPMAIHAAILCGASILGLVPYWVLRTSIQPLPGFGGY